MTAIVAKVGMRALTVTIAVELSLSMVKSTVLTSARAVLSLPQRGEGGKMVVL